MLHQMLFPSLPSMTIRAAYSRFKSKITSAGGGRKHAIGEKSDAAVAATSAAIVAAAGSGGVERCRADALVLNQSGALEPRQVRRYAALRQSRDLGEFSHGQLMDFQQEKKAQAAFVCHQAAELCAFFESEVHE